MGNSSSTPTNASRDERKKRISKEEIKQIYDSLIQALSIWCKNDQYPLNLLLNQTDIADQEHLIEISSGSTRTEDFNRYVIELLFKNRQILSKQDLTQLFRDVCFFDIKQNSPDDNQVQREVLDGNCFLSLVNSIFNKETIELDKDLFSKWIRENFVTFFYGFDHWLRKNYGKSRSMSSSSTDAKSDRKIMPMNNILNATWAWLLTHQLSIIYLSSDNTCTNHFERMNSVLHGKMWDHLYNSHRDGASLNRFQHHIFGYNGPTLMFFDTSDGYLFCLCCDEKFMESPKHFGGIQSSLIQLKPTFKTLIEGPKIIFMNTKLRGISSLGLFVGRDHSRVFMEIDSDFFNVKHLNGQGRLVAIDVWGVGGKKSTEAQQEMRQWENRQIEKSKKVNINYEEEETILNMAGIETRRAQDQF